MVFVLITSRLNKMFINMLWLCTLSGYALVHTFTPTVAISVHVKLFHLTVLLSVSMNYRSVTVCVVNSQYDCHYMIYCLACLVCTYTAVFVSATYCVLFQRATHWNYSRVLTCTVHHCSTLVLSCLHYEIHQHVLPRLWPVWRTTCLSHKL